MEINKRIKSFVTLGKFLHQFASKEVKNGNNSLNEIFYTNFEELIKTVHIYNQWFTEESV